MTTGYSKNEQQQWMRLLALAPSPLLEEQFKQLSPPPEYTLLKQPEVGIAMIQAKACGNGAPFYFGETPVTRCAVELNGKIGCGYVAGRKKRHALLIAIFDALLQHPEKRDQLQKTLLAPIVLEITARKEKKARETAATKVDFFTLVRGEDEQ